MHRLKWQKNCAATNFGDESWALRSSHWPLLLVCHHRRAVWRHLMCVYNGGDLQASHLQAAWELGWTTSRQCTPPSRLRPTHNWTTPPTPSSRRDSASLFTEFLHCHQDERGLRVLSMEDDMAPLAEKLSAAQTPSPHGIRFKRWCAQSLQFKTVSAV